MSLTSEIPRDPRDRAPPGRNGLPVLGETLAFLKSSEDFVAERRARYGPVFRTRLFGRPTVVMVGSEANRFILSTGMSKLSWRDGWPPSFRELLGDSLFLQDGAEHRRKRGLISPAFHLKALARYLAVMESRLDESLARWEKLGRFAWHGEFRRLNVEVASTLILGCQLGPALDELTRDMATWTRGLMSLPIRLPFTPYGRALRARDRLLVQVEQAIRQRQAEPAEDALGLLVAARDEDGQGLTDEELKSQALFLVAAGLETTASTLTSVVQALAQHPAVLAEARDEQTTLPIEGPITLDHLRRMTYLDRVLSEVERLHPAAGFGFRGVLEDFDFGGFTIPRGFQVVYSIEATHHDPAEFPDPARFDPDRWSVESRDERGDPHRDFKLVGFGGGARICLGMAFAKTQIKVIVSRLLREFQWELEPGQDLRARMAPTRTLADGLRVRISRKGG